MSIISTVSLLGTNYFNGLNIKSLNQQIQETTNQIATGQKTDIYAGLGTSASLSLSLHAQDDVINGYQSAIKNVQVRTDSMDNSLVNIANSISNTLTQMNKISQGGTPNLTVLQTTARNDLVNIQQQLNSAVDNKFVFSGNLNKTAPISNTGAVTTNVTTLITGYGAGSAPGIITSLNNLTSAQVGYDTNLAAAGAATVRVSDGQTVDYTVKADESQFKNAMVGLAQIANLTYDPNNATDFWALFNDAKSRLTSAQSQINLRNGQFGVARNQMKSAVTDNDNLQTTVQKNISNIETADVATAQTNLQNLTTQLQALYSTIGKVTKLTILDYLN